MLTAPICRLAHTGNILSPGDILMPVWTRLNFNHFHAYCQVLSVDEYFTPSSTTHQSDSERPHTSVNSHICMTSSDNLPDMFLHSDIWCSCGMPWLQHINDMRPLCIALTTYTRPPGLYAYGGSVEHKGSFRTPIIVEYRLWLERFKAGMCDAA